MFCYFLKNLLEFNLCHITNNDISNLLQNKISLEIGADAQYPLRITF